jgi:hypothetical protein
MPACHGAASAAPVYVYLRKMLGFGSKSIFNKSDTTTVIHSLGVLLSTLFTFSATAVGHAKSELKEAREKLAQ